MYVVQNMYTVCLMWKVQRPGAHTDHRRALQDKCSSYKLLGAQVVIVRYTPVTLSALTNYYLNDIVAASPNYFKDNVYNSLTFLKTSY